MGILAADFTGCSNRLKREAIRLFSQWNLLLTCFLLQKQVPQSPYEDLPGSVDYFANISDGAFKKSKSFLYEEGTALPGAPAYRGSEAVVDMKEGIISLTDSPPNTGQQQKRAGTKTWVCCNCEAVCAATIVQ